MSWFVAEEKMLVILDPSIDTSTPNGRSVANVLASVDRVGAGRDRRQDFGCAPGEKGVRGGDL